MRLYICWSRTAFQKYLIRYANVVPTISWSNIQHEILIVDRKEENLKNARQFLLHLPLKIQRTFIKSHFSNKKNDFNPVQFRICLSKISSLYRPYSVLMVKCMAISALLSVLLDLRLKFCKIESGHFFKKLSIW